MRGVKRFSGRRKTLKWDIKVEETVEGKRYGEGREEEGGQGGEGDITTVYIQMS